MSYDASDVEMLEEYAVRGPSQARTQLLLAQIIQLIGGFSGSTQPLGKLLPWLQELNNDNRTQKDEERRMNFMERQRQNQISAMQARKEKR